MQKIMIQYLILAYAILNIECKMFETNVQCQKCTGPCNNVNCYRINAPGFNQQICGNLGCTIGINYTVFIDQCNFDWSGEDCNTGICFYPETNSGCATTAMGIPKQKCASPYSYQMSCDSCKANTACSKCTFSGQTGAVLTENCLGTSCNGVQNISATISSCNLNTDIYGNPCDCCYNIINSVPYLDGICSNQLDSLSSSAFNVFARNTTIASTTAQSLLTVTALVILLLIVLLQ